MDKEWMKLPRSSPQYLAGMDMFLDFAFNNVGTHRGDILCPCKKCINNMWRQRNVVREHLIVWGFQGGYTNWTDHGEASPSCMVGNENEGRDDNVEDDHMPDMVHDIFMNRADDPCLEASKFQKYMSDANQELYPGCKTATQLSFIIWLFNLKCTSKWTNKSFDLLLGKLKEILPRGAKLPADFYETKKMVGDLGFSYDKIDACPNDCMLYWKENSDLQLCSVCEKSRWKTVLGRAENGEELETPTSGKKIAAKQLRHFPLIPRLQRLFMTSKTADSMRWHHEKRNKDGVLRHPADSEAWKHFDRLNPDFASDPRNVRLGLSTDGMDPYRHGSNHSIWPVTVVIYNLPPWMCMKPYHFIMPLLIPGPTSPGNDIDVYLRPLIEELKDLFVGIETYDASTKTNFIMRAVLLWTISDFPAYAMLSGWSTKGKKACPCCQECTLSVRIRGKECYMNHRCFLESDHKYRYEKRRFNGKCEYREAPVVPSGFHVFEKVAPIKVTFGKKTKNTVPNAPEHNWRKKSIFFELQYWRTLMIRHNLDVMHIEKNVCDNLIGTLLGMKGKSKDNLKARQDLKDMNIRAELHPIEIGADKYKLPAACFTMSKKEKVSALEVLKNVKVPDGYSSNISRCVSVKEGKISGLKSHDCHILMQQLLPIAIRGALPQHVCSAVIGLCRFFTELWSTNYRAEDFARLSKKIALTLCHLEMIFPPSFFDVMVHLPIHLAEEARIAGAAKYRQMYPFERYMFNIKEYIRNKSHPEGSIAEGYIAEECLTFCSRYLGDVVAAWNQPGRNDDGYTEHVTTGLSVFRKVGRFLWNPSPIHLDVDDREAAHKYVLFNCEEINQYRAIWRSAYLMKMGRRRPRERDIANAQKREFPRWFSNYVNDMGRNQVSAEIKALGRGPNDMGMRGNGYLINGYRFHTEGVEKKRKTQNSRVFVLATTRGYSSSRDVNPVEDSMEYFGILENVIELDYYGFGNVVLFKCKWYDTSRNGNGVKTDVNGFTLVNSEKFAYTEEPFVMPSQVEQLFYIDDGRDSGWRVVIRTWPRDRRDKAEAEEDDVEQLSFSNDPSIAQNAEIDIGDITWDRIDVDGEIVESSAKKSKSTQVRGQSSSNQPQKRIVHDTFIDDDDEEHEGEEEEEEEGDEDEDGDDSLDDEEVREESMDEEDDGDNSTDTEDDWEED